MWRKKAVYREGTKIFSPLLIAVLEISFYWQGTILLTTCLLQCKILILGSSAFDHGTEKVRIFSRKNMIKLGHWESLLGKRLLFFSAS